MLVIAMLKAILEIKEETLNEIFPGIKKAVYKTEENSN